MDHEPSGSEPGTGSSSAPPTRPTAVAPARADTPDALENYNAVAETVGMMPSLRLKDNLIQLIVILASTTLAFAISWFLLPPIGVIFITAMAFIVSGVISGFVLMILGWVRAAKRKKLRNNRQD